MALYTLIAVTAALAGGTAQDPSMDLQIATPVLHTESEVAPQQASVAATQANKVTAQFRNAKASEVLEWLEKRGVNFIVNDGDVKDDAKVSLSVTDVPLESVVDALASALGGHWERRGEIRVFRKGAGFFGGAQAFGGTLAPTRPLNMTVTPDSFMKLDGAVDKNFEKRMKEMAAEMEKKFGPEFQKKLEESIKVYTLEDRKLRELQGKEREEALKHAEKHRVEALKLSQEARKEAMKAAEEARKHAAEHRKEALKEAQKARAEAEKVRIEVRREGEKARSETLRSYSLGEGGTVYRIAPGTRDGRRTFITPSFPVNGMDMGKFLKSLSSQQRDTQRKRGFIRYEDLSREQKHLLGVRPEGKFEIRLKVNQDEVVVRGE